VYFPQFLLFPKTPIAADYCHTAYFTLFSSCRFASLPDNVARLRGDLYEIDLQITIGYEANHASAFIIINR